MKKQIRDQNGDERESYDLISMRKSWSTKELQLRKDLATAHRLTAFYGMEELGYNIHSARLNGAEEGTNAIEDIHLMTPNNIPFSEIRPEHFLLSSEL